MADTRRMQPDRNVVGEAAISAGQKDSAPPQIGHASQIKWGTVASLGLMVCNTALAMAASVLLARWLGPAGYGVYAFAFSICTLVAIPIQLGLPRLIVREVAKYQAREQWGLLRGIVKSANLMVVALVSVAICAILPILWLIADEQNLMRIQTIAWALLLLPIISLSSLRMAVLRGLRRVVLGQLPERLAQPLILIALAAAYSHYQFRPSDAMALTCVAAAIAFAMGTGFLIWSMPAEVKSAKTEYNRKNWASSLIPLSMVSAVSILGGRSDIFLLGIFSVPDSEIGYYRVAIAISGFVAIGLTAINVALAPHVANLYSRGKIVELQRIVMNCAIAAFVGATVAAAIFILAGRTILDLLYTPDYQDAYLLMVILCCGQLVSASAGSVALVLNMTGHEKVVLRISVYAILLNLILNVVLIQTHGALGAAIATSVSLAAANIALNIGARKATGIETSIMSVARRPILETIDS